MADLSTAPGTGIAAVNESNHLRVYTQDCQGGIRESMYEGKWSNGTIKNVIVQDKIGSALAACSKALNEVQINGFVYSLLVKAELCVRSAFTMFQLIISSASIVTAQERAGMPAASTPVISSLPHIPR
jgi:hypothetical protein